jgi:cytochrome c553
MKRIAPLLVLLACLPQAHAADIEAGRAKAAGVCAACHGATGISVAESIPNLAAQRAGYLAAQLRALKDGSRKNAMMNAIAAQLSAEDIANLAAYFAAQPGAQASSKSGLLPNMTATRVPFPVGFRDTFTRYHTMDFPATKQVRHFYANRLALEAARSGRPLPDGSVLLVEVHTARLDFDDKPMTGADGFFVAEHLLAYSLMGRNAGWGADIPEMLRNSDWNYAVFTPEGKPRTINQAECLACHKPLDRASYLFTLNELSRAK